MKKSTLFLSAFFALLLPATQAVFAQADFSDDLYYDNKVTYEVGGSIGIMNCFTDLGGRKGVGKNFVKDLNPGKSQPAGSIFLSAVYKNAIVIRSEATWGVVKASDAVLKKVKESTFGRYDRNLSFKSTIFEIALLSEIHPRYFKKYKRNEKLPRLSPYLLGGIGYFSFDPQAKYNGTWIFLRPLSTEGQGFSEYPNRKFYKLSQLNFPAGAGIKYKLSSTFNFSAECVYRILMTDYLDDVSTTYIDKTLYQKYFTGDEFTRALALHNRQNEINPAHTTNVGDIRGNPKNNDAYFSINFKLGLVF